MYKKHIIWITRSAVLIAMIVTVQAATIVLSAIPMLRQYLTGSLVNMILVISVMAVSTSTGVIVGTVSPLFASLLGVVPGWQWPLVPFIALGNVALVIVWHLLGKRSIVNKYATRCITIGASAVLKFAILYIGIVQVMLHILDLKGPQMIALSSAFSVTQIFTAVIGGVLASLALPVLKKAIKTEDG